MYEGETYLERGNGNLNETLFIYGNLGCLRLTRHFLTASERY